MEGSFGEVGREENCGYIFLGEFSAAFEGTSSNIKAEMSREWIVEEASPRRGIGGLLRCE